MLFSDLSVETDDAAGLFTPRDELADRTVKEILNDAADGKETIFLVNLLSFIKDGNIKCLPEHDRRAWAEQVWESTTTRDQPASVRAAELFKDPMANEKPSVPKPFDMDSWRTVLVHLRTNYPVGVAGKLANAKFNEENIEIRTLEK